MIKVNLAGSQKHVKVAAPGAPPVEEVENPQRIQRQGAIKGLLLLLGPLALWLFQSNVLLPEKNHVLSEMQKNVNELSEKNAQAASAVAEMKSFEDDESRLKEQIGVIDNLRKDRMREVRVLDVVQREMPEHMWLEKVELNDGRIRISGMAGTDSDITQLMDTLNRSGLLKEVNLINTSEQIIEGNSLKEFSIDCGFPKIESAPTTTTPGHGGKA